MEDIDKILPGLKDMKFDGSIPDDAVLEWGGYINEHVYAEKSVEMKKNNPMHKPESVEKMRQTKLRKFASGELKPNVMGEDARREASERMKKNNPLSKNPELTNTAKPVDVYYENGNIESFAYAKLIPNIPYMTVKWMMRNNKGSKKHKVIKIIQKERN